MDGEFGEDELLEMNNMDPEMLEKIQNGTITEEELKKLGYDGDLANCEPDEDSEDESEVEGPGLEKKAKEE